MNAARPVRNLVPAPFDSCAASPSGLATAPASRESASRVVSSCGYTGPVAKAAVARESDIKAFLAGGKRSRQLLENKDQENGVQKNEVASSLIMGHLSIPWFCEQKTTKTPSASGPRGHRKIEARNSENRRSKLDCANLPPTDLTTSAKPNPRPNPAPRAPFPQCQTRTLASGSPQSLMPIPAPPIPHPLVRLFTDGSHPYNGRCGTILWRSTACPRIPRLDSSPVPAIW